MRAVRKLEIPFGSLSPVLLLVIAGHGGKGCQFPCVHFFESSCNAWKSQIHGVAVFGLEFGIHTEQLVRDVSRNERCHHTS